MTAILCYYYFPALLLIETCLIYCCGKSKLLVQFADGSYVVINVHLTFNAKICYTVVNFV